MTKTTKTRRYLPATAEMIAALEAKGPKGFKFRRAAWLRSSDADIEGVELQFTKTPLKPPTLRIKPERKGELEEFLGGEINGATFTQTGTVDIGYGGEAGTPNEKHRVIPGEFADAFFDVFAERRPKLLAIQLHQFENLPAGLLKADHLISVVLTRAQIRTMFNLGDDVEVLGVKSHWDGPSVPGRGVCTGFSIRVRS